MWYFLKYRNEDIWYKLEKRKAAIHQYINKQTWTKLEVYKYRKR